MNRDQTIVLSAESFGEYTLEKMKNDPNSYGNFIDLHLSQKLSEDTTDLIVRNMIYFNQFCTYLIPYIKTKPNIVNFTFISYGNNPELLTDTTLVSLLEAMATRQNITELILNNDVESYEFLNELSAVLKNNPNLETLELRMSNDMVPHLPSVLQEANNLKDLTLVCSDLTTESADILTPALSQLFNLKGFKLQEELEGKQTNPAVDQLNNVMKTIRLARESFDAATKLLAKLSQNITNLHAANLAPTEKEYQEFLTHAKLARDLNYPDSDRLITRGDLSIGMSILGYKNKNVRINEQINVLETANSLLLPALLEDLTEWSVLESAINIYLEMISNHKKKDLDQELLQTAFIGMEEKMLAHIETAPSETEMANAKLKLLIPLYEKQFRSFTGEEANLALGKMKAIVKDKELQKVADARLLATSLEKYSECLELPKKTIDFAEPESTDESTNYSI